MSHVTGAGRVAGIFGWPVTHSRSPLIHNHWLARHGIDGAYIPFAATPENFADAFRALPKLGFAGGNMTIPHKETAMKLADEVDPVALRIGAANTVIVTETGAIRVTNTDGTGFLLNLDQEAPGWKQDRPAVVLGAGGGARAIIAALVDRGLPEVRLLNRTKARAEQVASDIGGPVTVIDWSERNQALAGAGLLVNTTSLGMEKQPPLNITLDDLPLDGTVADIVYAPVITDLLAAGRSRGNAICTGPGMLLHQAVPGFELWFGVRPVVDDALRKAAFPEIYGHP